MEREQDRRRKEMNGNELKSTQMQRNDQYEGGRTPWQPSITSGDPSTDPRVQVTIGNLIQKGGEPKRVDKES